MTEFDPFPFVSQRLGRDVTALLARSVRSAPNMKHLSPSDTRQILSIVLADAMAEWDDLKGLPEDRLIGWAKDRANKRAVDEIRAQSRFRKLRARARPRTELVPEDAVDREALWTELVRLPEIDRRIVWTYYFEGRTQKETAERLGMTVPALKARLHRLRVHLRKRLT